jgi:hypothetical protein
MTPQKKVFTSMGTQKFMSCAKLMLWCKLKLWSLRSCHDKINSCDVWNSCHAQTKTMHLSFITMKPPKNPHYNGCKVCCIGNKNNLLCVNGYTYVMLLIMYKLWYLEHIHISMGAKCIYCTIRNLVIYN